MQLDVDRAVRLAAFGFLSEATALRGDVLPRSLLLQGFQFEGRRVPLLGPQGIFKPAVIPGGVALSITTAPLIAGKPRPYDDEATDEGLIAYRYRGTDPLHHENVGLRRAMTEQIPLIYLYGIARGEYLAQWPVFIVGDDPASLTFTVAVDDPAAIRPDLSEPVIDDARRRYVTRLARHRLHQVAFRQRVLAAYRESCAVCRLRHVELLDAAHILPDSHPRGEPIVPNGLALCKLHHAAFDRHILGVTPDLEIRIRHDILEEVDGPMLQHGLKETHGGTLVVPRAASHRPSREFLAERFELFERAS